MNIKCKILGLFSLFSTLISAQHTTYDWAKQLGGIGNDYINTITTDDLNQIYIAGSFESTADLDPGSGVLQRTTISPSKSDIFINKLDPNGDLLWSKQIGGSGVETVADIQLDDFKNIYVCGLFKDTLDFDPGPGVFNLFAFSNRESGFILKLDSNGNFLWARHLTGLYSNRFNFLEVNSNNEIYATGFFQDSVQVAGGGVSSQKIGSVGGSQDAIILKMDANGNVIWAKTVGGPGQDFIFSTLVDQSDNLYFGGTYQAGADLDPDTGIFVSNSTTDETAVVKLTPLGIFEKALLFGDGALIYSMIKDNNNHLIITGNLASTTDFDPGPGTFSLSSNPSIHTLFACKLNGSENFVWAKATESTLAPGFSNTSSDVDSQGSVYLTGNFYRRVDFDPSLAVQSLTSMGGSDAYILKLDAQGNFNWVNQLGGLGSSTGLALHIDQSDHLITAGRFDANVDFDPSPLVNNVSSYGGFDAYLYKINASQVVNFDEVEKHLAITVHGNPTSDFVLINVNEHPNLNYRLMDIRGKILEQGYVISSSFQLELKENSGVYLLQLFNSNSSRIIKLIKK